MFQCQYCDSKLASENSLISHQKRTKKCIEIQKTLNLEVPEPQNCIYCCKEFTRKNDKNKHELICRGKKISSDLENIKTEYEFKLQQLEKKITELETNLLIETTLRKSYEKVALKPRVIRADPTASIPSLPSIDQLKSMVAEHYTHDLFKEGQVGVAKFLIICVKKLNNGSVVWSVSDNSRKTIKYKNENGEMVFDPKGIKLAILVYEVIKDCAQTYYHKVCKPKRNRVLLKKKPEKINNEDDYLCYDHIEEEEIRRCNREAADDENFDNESEDEDEDIGDENSDKTKTENIFSNINLIPTKKDKGFLKTIMKECM